MIEKIGYEVTEQGLKIEVPQDLGDRFLNAEVKGNWLEIVRYASVPRRNRVVTIDTLENGDYTVDLDYKKAGSLATKVDRGTAVSHIATAHRQVVEHASGDQRNETVEINYTYQRGPGGVLPMLAFMRARDDMGPAVDGEVQGVMRHTAHLLHPRASEDELHRTIRSQLSDDFVVPRLIVNSESDSVMTAMQHREETGDYIALRPVNIFSNVQQLICLAGLAAYARNN